MKFNKNIVIYTNQVEMFCKKHIKIRTTNKSIYIMNLFSRLVTCKIDIKKFLQSYKKKIKDKPGPFIRLNIVQMHMISQSSQTYRKINKH